MKDLLVIALLAAVPAAGRAADPVDPAPATSTSPSAGARKSAGAAAAKRAAGGRKARPAEGQAKKQETKTEAGPKAEKPCEPVKPCPID
jgi:hypothetical protein